MNNQPPPLPVPQLLLDELINNKFLIKYPCDKTNCPNNFDNINEYNRSVLVTVRLNCSKCGKHSSIYPNSQSLSSHSWRHFYQYRENCCIPKPCRFILGLSCLMCFKPLIELKNGAPSEEEYWRSVIECYWNDTRLPVLYNEAHPYFARVPDDAKYLMLRLFNFPTSYILRIFQFPMDIDLMWKAFDYSIKTPGKLLYELLKMKIDNYIAAGVGLNQNRSPLNVYLRIGVPIGNLARVGVLEIWPKGHFALPHLHAGCAGAIKVIRGQLKITIFDSVLPYVRSVINEIDIAEHQICWLSRNHFSVHSVKATLEYCNFKNIEFCASFHVYKNCEKEYFAFSLGNEILRGVPKNDITENEWEQKVKQIWNDYCDVMSY